jgi:glutamine synthetase
VNSYRRLAPNMWSSAYTAWGPDNREAAVRVASPFKGRVEATTNIEIKGVDGSANPYLALGAILAAGLDGVRRELDPGEPVSVNPHDLDEAERQARGIRPYPSSLAEAVDALQNDKMLVDALGTARAHEFMAVRRSEWDDLGSGPVEREIAAHFRRY